MPSENMSAETGLQAVDRLLTHIQDLPEVGIEEWDAAQAALPVLAAAVRERERFKDDYEHACGTVAEMHAAAVGEVTGPIRGVVEDVADLRTENAALRAEVEGLREALLTYGHHKGGCRVSADECDCGILAALSSGAAPEATGGASQ